VKPVPVPASVTAAQSEYCTRAVFYPVGKRACTLRGRAGRRVFAARPRAAAAASVPRSADVTLSARRRGSLLALQQELGRTRRASALFSGLPALRADAPPRHVLRPDDRHESRGRVGGDALGDRRAATTICEPVARCDDGGGGGATSGVGGGLTMSSPIAQNAASRGNAGIVVVVRRDVTSILPARRRLRRRTRRARMSAGFMSPAMWWNRTILAASTKGRRATTRTTTRSTSHIDRSMSSLMYCIIVLTFIVSLPFLRFFSGRKMSTDTAAAKLVLSGEMRLCGDVRIGLTEKRLTEARISLKGRDITLSGLSDDKQPVSMPLRYCDEFSRRESPFLDDKGSQVFSNKLSSCDLMLLQDLAKLLGQAPFTGKCPTCRCLSVPSDLQ